MGEDTAIDQDALVRLEALQRQRMMDMFGYDPDEELVRKRKAEAERRKAKAAAGDKDEVPDGGKISRHKKKKLRLALEATSSPSKAPGALGKGVVASDELPWPLGGAGKGGLAGAKGGKDGKGGAKKLVQQLSRVDQERLRAAELEEERKAFMSPHVKRVSLFGSDAKKDEEVRGRKRKGLGDEAKEFVSAQRIVAELGATTFWGKQKKEWEAKKLQELGAKKAKNEKVPYNILMGRLKKQGEREEKRKVVEKQAGLAPSKAGKKAKPKAGKAVSSHATSGVMRVKDPTAKGGASGGFKKGRGGGARRGK